MTRRIPQDAIALLAQRCDVDENGDDRPYTPAELAARGAGADALVTLLTDRVDEALLRACPRLRVVANVAVGYDNVDVAAAARRGIAVTNTPGVLTDATADFALALILAVTRRVVEADRFVRDGRFTEWMMMGLLGAELRGRTLGIAGFGRIGQAVARRAVAFGMRVIYTGGRGADAVAADLGAHAVDKATLLARSDVLSLHVPLGDATRHFIGADELRAMKPTAYLVNTARGPIVDEAALVAALRNGEIAGAGLDVFEREPAVDPGLVDLPNVVLAPHIGSATVETRTKMAVTAAENVVAVLSGHPPLTPVR